MVSSPEGGGCALLKVRGSSAIFVTLNVASTDASLTRKINSQQQTLRLFPRGRTAVVAGHERRKRPSDAKEKDAQTHQALSGNGCRRPPAEPARQTFHCGCSLADRRRQTLLA